jgi:RNA polymerase sigma factor (sigma-70 family)
MTKRSFTEAQSLLEDIKRGDERTLNELYNKTRPAFIRWGLKDYDCSEEEVIEIFQKAFTVLYFNVRDGKLTEMSSTVETYLLGVGKLMFLELFRRRARAGQSLDDVPDVAVLDTDYLDKETRNHRQQVTAQLLAQLGESCRQILKLYYFRKFSMESIAEDMGYKNDKVAKKKKYECLKQLRDMVEKKGYQMDDLM